MKPISAALPNLGSSGLFLVNRETPPEDRHLSPYTGLTRAHWVESGNDLLDSAQRFRSRAGGRFDFPGRPSRQGARADGLEGFARTLQLAAFLYVGEPSEPHRRRLDGYLEGLIAGTSSAATVDTWEPIGHVEGRWGQLQVEAANIALSLRLTREATWDRMTVAQQDDLTSWLRTALDKEPSSNNWYLFTFTIGSFLESVGRGDAESSLVIRRGLALIEDWYRGRGWYSDGDGEAYDHYIGWALHLYPLLHARLARDDELDSRLGDRLREFLETFARTFDRNGAPLYMGRSLTYRTGTLAAIALGQVTGHSPLSAGQSRRLMSATLRYFLERGARTDGVLSLGWHGPHEASLQRYSGPGSPYWASKGFLGLMLSADHDLWTAEEAAVPGDVDDHVDPIAPVGLMIQTTACDGIVRVHNHGSDKIKVHEPDSGAPDPLYGRFAYSTRTGSTAMHNPSDNDFQISFREVWSSRRRIHKAGAGEDWIASWHHPRFPVFAPLAGSDESPGGPVLPSARIQSVTVADGPFEVRIQRLFFAPERSPVRLAGWAIAGDRPEDTLSSSEGLAARVDDRGGLTSWLFGLEGWTSASTAVATWGTAYGAWAVVPELYGSTDASVFISVASLSTEVRPGSPDEVARVSRQGSVVHVEWVRSSRTSVIDLDSLSWAR